MRWPFRAIKTPDITSNDREFVREQKVAESQRILLEAATSTAEAANYVTSHLRTKLMESMEQFEGTAKILNDALIICDENGMIQAFNPAAERMFEKSLQDVKGLYVGNLFKSEYDLSNSEKMWDIISNIGVTNIKGVRGSETFSLGINYAKLERSEQSSIILLIIRDISIFAENEDNYKTIFEADFDGVLVVKDKHVVAANPTATKLFGYNVGELLSKPLDTLFISEKCEGRHRDGHIMEMFFTTTTIFWNGEPASLITIKNIATDVDSIESEKMICCFNHHFQITFCNQAFAKFYKSSKKTLLGSDIRDLIPPEERDPFLIHINSLTPAEPSKRMQLRTKKNGVVKLEVWTDHANYTDETVEYQRVGRDITHAKPLRRVK